MVKMKTKQTKKREVSEATKPRAWAAFFRRYGHAPIRVERRGRWCWVAVGGTA